MQVAALRTPGAAAVLAKATLRAAEGLGVSRRDLGRVLGISEATVSRIAHGRAIDPTTKEGELALLFVRVFRSLDALVGGDLGAARDWLRAENSHLGAVPAEMLLTVGGLVHVLEYLDALRGRG